MGFSSDFKKIGGLIIKGPPAVSDKNPPFTKANFSQKKSVSKPNQNTLAQTKPKDDSVFAGGKSYVKEKDRINWLKSHYGDVVKKTRGRINSRDELKEFEKELFSLSVTKKQEYGRYSPKEVVKNLQKGYFQEKRSEDRQNVKENIEIAKKMFGLDKKK